MRSTKVMSFFRISSGRWGASNAEVDIIVALPAVGGFMSVGGLSIPGMLGGTVADLGSENDGEDIWKLGEGTETGLGLLCSEKLPNCPISATALGVS